MISDELVLAKLESWPLESDSIVRGTRRLDSFATHKTNAEPSVSQMLIAMVGHVPLPLALRLS